MALKDTLFTLIDNVGLAETFKLKPHDPAKARQPLLKGIDSAKKQFENGQTKAPNRWWKVSNNVVALTVKLAGDTFTINGVQTNHMPAERFPEFLDKFKAAVESGEFDKELASHGKGDAKVHIAPKRQSSGGGTRGPRDPKSNLRSSVGRSLRNGRSFEEIEAILKADGKFSASDIDAVIAEKKAAQNA